MSEKQEGKYTKIIQYASTAMSLFYMAMGAMLLFTKIFNIAESNKLILGIALIGYGIYRLYRIINKIKSDKIQS